jgi:hypothetical protein
MNDNFFLVNFSTNEKFICSRGEMNPFKNQTHQDASSAHEKEMQQQLDKFVASAPTDFLVSSVSWWGQKRAREEFPLLLPMVRKLQCVPGTCITHKRVKGDDFAWSRHQMKEDSVDSLLFLSSNSDLLG